MGYQESLIKVRNLAEAAGIRRAFMEHAQKAWIMYCATEHARKPGFLGDRPCVIVAGQRSPYQHDFGRWAFLDDFEWLTKENYRDYFEAYDDEDVAAAWDDDPATALHAYEIWSVYLVTVDSLQGTLPEIEHEIIYGSTSPDGIPPETGLA